MASELEAIRVLRGIKKAQPYDGQHQKTIDVLDLAIDSLEKQMGKKPILHPKPLKNEVFWWNCPHCGAHNHTNTRHNFCHHCGGRIDWSDENDER